jgi:hypothetical protein
MLPYLLPRRNLVPVVGFNGHPPLGVNATLFATKTELGARCRFQWAPTLGGECYQRVGVRRMGRRTRFNGHPPLGVNATCTHPEKQTPSSPSFNGHPPLGVNATDGLRAIDIATRRVSMGTHPWG